MRPTSGATAAWVVYPENRAGKDPDLWGPQMLRKILQR